MGEKGNVEENSFAMREAAAAALRIDPIRLLAQGRESSLTSRIVHSTDGQLQIETTDNKAARSGHPQPKSMMTVDSDTKLGLLQTSMHSDFTITNVQGQSRQVMKGQYDLSGTVLDDIYNQHQISKRSLTLTDAAGSPLQAYEPAGYKTPAGKFDPNGQPVRLVESSNGKSNCDWENGVDSAKGQQCVSLIRDNKVGNLGYFQTATNKGSLEYKAVLRTEQGAVLGILQQNFMPDGRIITTARKPHEPKQ